VPLKSKASKSYKRENTSFISLIWSLYFTLSEKVIAFKIPRVDKTSNTKDPKILNIINSKGNATKIFNKTITMKIGNLKRHPIESNILASAVIL
jgi:hypothetical protein